MVLMLRSSEGSGFPDLLGSGRLSTQNFPFLIFNWLGGGVILLHYLLSDLVHSVEVSVSCGLLCFTSLLLHKGSLVPSGTLHINFFIVDLIYFFCMLSHPKGLCTQQPFQMSLHVQNSLLLATPYLLQPSCITVRLQVYVLSATTATVFVSVRKNVSLLQTQQMQLLQPNVPPFRYKLVS